MSGSEATFMSLDHATLVQIYVVTTIDGVGLEVFPKRKGDTTVFHAKTAALATPWKPKQVCWAVSSMSPGQRLVIERKKSASNFGADTFPKTRYVIDHPDNSISSGDAEESPPPGQSDMQWNYSITLYADHDETKVPLALLDPMIVIKNDP